jgi:serine/threonine protein kinase
MIDETISHYKISEKLGWGGMGVVYKAQDLKLDRFVALKFLPAKLSLDEEAKEMFIQEAKAASSLQHHNICTIHEINNTIDGKLFISMDYYEGETLYEKIKLGRLNINESINIIVQILDGLSAAHEKGIVHRDIKPANIFITDRYKVKILDFGLATSSAYTKITRTDRAEGTIAYISPEQAQGKEATHKSDIWSLGVVMYEMLTGQLPFKGDFDQVLIYSILDKDPEKITFLNPEVSTDLANVVNQALEKDVDLRYQNVDEMLVDLRHIENESALSETTQSTIELRKNNKWVTRITFLVVFLALFMFVFYFTRPILFGDENTNIPVTLAVVGFENQTGDPNYNYLQKAIPNLLITNLEQSKSLRVATWERMYDLLKQTHKEKVELIDKNMGFEICQVAGIDAIVVGSFVKAGEVFVTDVKVLDAKTKKLLKSANIKSNGLASILNDQIDYLSDEIVVGVGLTAKEIESVKLRIADVSTNSLEAYNYFLKGREEYEKYYLTEALPNFERALQIDSTFAVAYLYKGLANHLLYDMRERDKAIFNAWKHKNHATEKEQYFIDGLKLVFLDKDTIKAAQIMEAGLKRYPAEKEMHMWVAASYRGLKNNTKAAEKLNDVLKLDPQNKQAFRYLGDIYTELKEYDKAIENMNKYISLYPEDPDPYTSFGLILYKMGRLDEAIKQYQKAVSIKEDFLPSALLPTLLALREDYDAAKKSQNKQIKLFNSIDRKASAYWWKAFLLYWTGSHQDALYNLEKTFETQKHSENTYFSPRISWLRAWIYYDMGDLKQSRIFFKSFYNYTKTWAPNDPYWRSENQFYLGLVNLKEGAIDSVYRRLEMMKSNFDNIPLNKLEYNRAHYQLLYAETLIKQDSLNKAEFILKKKSPFINDPNLSPWKMIHRFTDPLLQDGLARIYIKKGKLNKAIEVYEKLISHDLDVRELHFIPPLYHYRLAKLYEKKGLKEKAVGQYETFIEIWKNADKDLQKLIDAKRRLAGLTEN